MEWFVSGIFFYFSSPRHKDPSGFKSSPIITGFFLTATLIAGFLASGCGTLSTVDQILDPKVYYKQDMKLEINGKDLNGMGVVEMSQSYKIKIRAKGDVDLLKIFSCHREFSTESAASKAGWFESKRGYEWKYQPVEDLETKGLCLVRFEAYDKDKGRHSWAIFDIRNQPEVYSLPVDMKCNGEVKKNIIGVSMCGSRAGLNEPGLLQELKFPVPVAMASRPGKFSKDPNSCKIPVPSDNMTFKYQIPNRECYFTFQEIDGDGRIHRHTSIGWEEVPIRGE